MKRGVGLAIVFLVLCLCAGATARMGRITGRAPQYEHDIDTLQIAIDSEEYAVLSAYIKSHLGSYRSKPLPECIEIMRPCDGSFTVLPRRSVVVTDDTSSGISASHDYDETEARRWRWDARFDFGIEYRWFDYGHPPNETCEGGFSFSRVGFDSARTEASFTLGTYYMGHMTGGFVVTMEKRDGGWIVTMEKQILYF
jgi:hypothetical protein